MEVLHLTKDTFDEAISTDKKVLVDFWASWCGPCSMMSPVLEEIAAEDHDFIVAKVNVDEQPELAQRFNVRSIPMLAVMKNGSQIAVTVGVQAQDELIKFVQEA